MKNSEIYHLAQIAVLASACISPENKLEVLKTLIADEGMAKFVENREAEERKAKEGECGNAETV